MKNSPIWALIQGQVFTPTICRLVPPPPSRLSRGYQCFDVPDGSAYGPLTYSGAKRFAAEMFDYKTLCIVAGNGLQAVWLDGLAWHKAKDEIGSDLLPGMTFFPEDGGGILLLGHGQPFPDIRAVGVAASCTPQVAFPVGRVWAAPVRHRRGENLRDSLELEWMPPNVSTLEDLAPLAAFLAELNLTAQDQADFCAAELARKADEVQRLQETFAYWKAKDEAEACAVPATRRMQP